MPSNQARRHGPCEQIGRTQEGQRWQSRISGSGPRLRAEIRLEVSQQVSEQVNAKLGPQPPQGGIFHAEGPTEDGGWWVFDVWASDQDKANFDRKSWSRSCRRQGSARVTCAGSRSPGTARRWARLPEPEAIRGGGLRHARRRPPPGPQIDHRSSTVSTLSPNEDGDWRIVTTSTIQKGSSGGR